MTEEQYAELFYEIFEILTPRVFCDRDATDLADEIMTKIKEHQEQE